jgi:hypothetical protein
MRTLSLKEVNEVHGSGLLAAAIVGGLVNSAVWGGWTVFVDHRVEKVTVKKSLLIFTLGAIATVAGTWML